MNAPQRSLVAAGLGAAAALLSAAAGEVHEAAKPGDLQLLLDANPALVNALDDRRRTPLHFAAESARRSHARQFLELVRHPAEIVTVNVSPSLFKSAPGLTKSVPESPNPKLRTSPRETRPQRYAMIKQ